MAKKNPHEVAMTNWQFETGIDGTMAPEQITAAGVTALYQETRRLHQTMRDILGRLDSLGRDGLHEVIHEHARAAKLAKQRRLAAARRRRAKLKVA